MNLFSAESFKQLNPKGKDLDESGRINVGETVWEVLVIYKDCNTETKIDGAVKLHLMFGHKSAAYIKEAIHNNKACMAIIKNDLRQLDVPLFCSVCDAAKSRSTRAEREFPLATEPFQSTGKPSDSGAADP